MAFLPFHIILNNHLETFFLFLNSVLFFSNVLISFVIFFVCFISFKAMVSFLLTTVISCKCSKMNNSISKRYVPDEILFYVSEDILSTEFLDCWNST